MSYRDQKHNYNCWLRRNEWEEQVAIYDNEWPDHCKACDGAGKFEDTYDPSPAGVSLGSGTITDVAICDECVQDFPMRCPRCGGTWVYGDADNYDDIVDDIVSNEKPCSRCGWNWAKTPGDWRPQEPECFCWYEDSKLIDEPGEFTH